MDAETLFLILGLTLTALAVVVSFVGLRMESFPPSRGVLAAGIGVFAVLVGATAVFAWEGGEEEQEHRNEERAAGELPTPAEIVAEYQQRANEFNAAKSGLAPAPGEEAGAEGAAVEASADGAALFEEQGCGSCHVLEAAGSTGTVGPDLDQSLEGADLASIEESIVDPEAEIADGFPAGVMPANFGDALSPEQLEALVQYIADSVGVQG